MSLVIDAYNNAWQPIGTSDFLTSESHTIEDMLTGMDAAGVDKAVVCSLGQQIDNEYITKLTTDHSDRLIGFAEVNPRTSDAVDLLEEYIGRGRLRGLKLHPTMHGYHFADHGLLDPVFDACSKWRAPILVNALDDPFCGPFAVEEISRNFPQVPVLLAHMGHVWNSMEAVIVSERNPQIYLETSSTDLIEVKSAYARLGANKLVLGTDWPGNDFDLERAKVQRAITDPGDRAKVEGENLSSLLSLRGGE
jgi:predicted TIM-barrel fold metal-dependent hydrolase